MNENRREFLNRMNGELDAIDAQLDQFRAEFREGSSAGAKFRADDELQALEQQHDAVRRQSRELEDFDGEKWDLARRDIERRRDELKASLARARNRWH